MAPGFFSKIGQAFKKVGNGIKNVATKAVNFVKNNAGAIVGGIANVLGGGQQQEEETPQTTTAAPAVQQPVVQQQVKIAPIRFLPEVQK